MLYFKKRFCIYIKIVKVVQSSYVYPTHMSVCVRTHAHTHWRSNPGYVHTELHPKATPQHYQHHVSITHVLQLMSWANIDILTKVHELSRFPFKFLLNVLFLFQNPI